MIAVARYTLLEMSRRRLLLALLLGGLGLVVALGMAPYILPGVDRNPATKVDFVLTGLDRFVGFFPLLAGFAIGMTVIYNDIDSGAIVAILAKPVSRIEYAAGKAVAALAGQVMVGASLALATCILLLPVKLEGLDYGAVISYFLAGTANAVVLVLLLMAVTTRINNIVSAVAAFIVYELAGGITTLHDFVVQNAPIAAAWKAVINVAYALVPHQLFSGLPREIIRLEIQAGQFATFMATHPGYDPYHGVPSAAGITDVLSWAAYCLVVASILYVAVRRRQV